MSLETRIRRIYAQAARELTTKVNSFFADFERLDKEKKALVEAGKLTEEAYKEWRKNKLLRGEDYIALRDNITARMLDANKIAASYINREMTGAYTKGFNRVGRDAEDVLTGYSFSIVNEATVKRLVTNGKTLLPYKIVDGRRDVRWNTKKVNAQILQGILQGESSKQMADRLMGVCDMNRASAVRNARTAFTSAANHGRQDAMKQLQDDGVILEKEWLASVGDGRTRDAHLELHHVSVPVDEPFENEIGQIMFPGDPDADPANVYNCRCSIATKIIGFKSKEDDNKEDDNNGESHEEETSDSTHETDAESEQADRDKNLNDELDEIWTPKGDYEPAESKSEFIKANKDAMKEDGVKGSELMEQFEDTMMHEAQEHLHQVEDEFAVDIVRDNLPDSYMRGWFVDADSEYKPKLEELILGHPDVLNAGWNIAYRDFMETVGADSGITFEQFMYTPMPMFRGTHGQVEVAKDVWSSFSMDRKVAEKFAGASGSVEEIWIRPIDTWGAYQTTGEAEILVPKRMLDKLRGG